MAKINLNFTLALVVIFAVILNFIETSVNVTDSTEEANVGELTTPLTLDDELKSKVNFLRMTHRNCSVAYLMGNRMGEEGECVVGFWMQGQLPIWLHPVPYEELLDTVQRASEEQLDAFTEQLCPCKNVEVSSTCPENVTEKLIPLITPCFQNRTDSEDVDESHIIPFVKKAISDMKLFEDMKALINETLQQEVKKNSSLMQKSFTPPSD